MSIFIMKSSGFSDEEIPYCHHAIIYKGVYEPHIICPINDPRVEEARKKGEHMVTEIPHSSVHNFDDYGYLRCNKCGWTP